MTPYTYTTEIPLTGYQLLKASIGRATVELLTDGLPIGARCKVRQIEPLACPALFREFAELDDASSILAFTNKNGLLGLPPREALGPDDGTGDRFKIHGELLTDWRQQAKHMRRAISAWERGQRRAVTEAVAPFLEGVSPRFIFGADSTGLVFEPHNLLAALWLQFALGVEGGRCCRRCPPPCGKWLTGNARTCSGACRQRAYRERKRGGKVK